MKIKLFSWIAILSLTTTIVSAQKIVYNPAAPDPDAPLTVTIDLEATSNANLAGIDPTPDIYIWTWVENVGDSPTNGSWNASAPANKMTRVGTTGKKYSYTYGPTLKDYFGKSADAMYGNKLGCLAKGIDGAGTPEKKTEDILLLIPRPVIGEQLIGSFPVKLAPTDSVLIDPDDVITLTYGNSLDTLTAMQNVGPDDIYAQLRVTVGGQTFNYCTVANIDVTPTLKMISLGAGKYELQFIPSLFFTDPACVTSAAITAKLATGAKMEKISYKVQRKRAIPGSSVGANPYVVGPPEYPILIPKH